MKRLAKIVLIFSMLLITLQPRVVLHFCGDEFVSFYLNQEPSLIQHDCSQENYCEPNDACKKNTEGVHRCPKRHLVVVDVNADDYTPTEFLLLDIHSALEDVLLAETAPFLLSVKMERATLWKLPPKNIALHSGRAILTRHCIFTI